MTATFTPHLLPLDQGELVSCYVTTSEPWEPGRASTPRTARGPTRTPFVEIVATPPGVRDVRDTNVCAICRARRRAHGQGLRLRGDRQPLEGRGVAGVQNLNLMFGLPETLGIEP